MKKFIFSLACGIIIIMVCVKMFGTSFDKGLTELTDIKTENYTYQESGNMHRGNLILVNSENPYVFGENNSLKSVFSEKNNQYQVSDKNVQLSEDAIQGLNEMAENFSKKAGKNDLIVISGFRNREKQQQLFSEKAAETGEAEAAWWVARPGASEHHTGFALDFGIYPENGQMASYDGTGKYAWLNQNCWRYGFVVRYDDAKKELTRVAHEPWHFRYVGLPHAYAMVQKNFCLEEYISFLKEYPFGEKHLLSQGFEIYYVPAEKGSVPVPKGREYSVSGNNVDGFIVTAKWQ